jgi:hypothetical protein
MADITTTRIFTDGEKGITAAKLNDIVASSVIQPAFVSSKPVASTADPADNLLLLKAAGTYAQVPVSTLTTSIGNALPSPDSEIWLVRLRSFNAVGNPSMEVDQVNCGNAITNPANSTKNIDRWQWVKVPAVTTNHQRFNPAAGSPILVPGTNFPITNCYYRINNQAVVSTPAATDVVNLFQFIEGSAFREISNDVHSISLLVRCSVAGLKFGLALRDNPGGGATRTLTKLCTISTANVWTLIQLSNLPVWPSAGTFSLLPGAAAYSLTICLMAGGTATSPANDTWQTGNFSGAVGQSNFCAQAVNSTFDIAFVQHEPGPVCSTLMDKTFSQNLDECLRYYEKSLAYGTKPGTITAGNQLMFASVVAPTAQCITPVRFKKIMAKAPTVTGYSQATGLINNVRDVTNSADRAITSVTAVSDSGFSGFQISSGSSSTWQVAFDYTADTGW